MLRLRVKEIAESRGISRGKLSRMADLSYPTIRDIFADPYRDVPMSTVACVPEFSTLQATAYLVSRSNTPGSIMLIESISYCCILKSASTKT